MEHTFAFCLPHAWAAGLASPPDGRCPRTDAGSGLSRGPAWPSLPTDPRLAHRPARGRQDGRGAPRLPRCLSICGRKRAPRPGPAGSLGRAAPRQLLGTERREASGAKRDEHGNVPGSRLGLRVESRRRGRAGPGSERRRRRRGEERGPQAQSPVLPRGGAGAADQVTERSSGAAGSGLVLSRRLRRRRRRHTYRRSPGGGSLGAGAGSAAGADGRAAGGRAGGCRGAGCCGEGTPRRPPRLALSPARRRGAGAMGALP